MIHIYSEPQPGMKLKSFGAVSKGAKFVLKIEVEIDDPQQLGWLLRELAELDKAQKRAPRRPLALPKPEATP